MENSFGEGAHFFQLVTPPFQKNSTFTLKLPTTYSLLGENLPYIKYPKIKPHNCP